MSRLPIGNLGPGQIVKSNGIALVGLDIGDGLEIFGNTLRSTGTLTGVGNGEKGDKGDAGEDGQDGTNGVDGTDGTDGVDGSGGSGDSVLAWMNL